MKGRSLEVNDIFVVVDRGDSSIYEKLKGGKFKELVGDTLRVIKFRPMLDFEESELKEKLKNCDVVKIDRIRTGLRCSISHFKAKLKRSS